MLLYLTRVRELKRDGGARVRHQQTLYLTRVRELKPNSSMYERIDIPLVSYPRAGIETSGRIIINARCNLYLTRVRELKLWISITTFGIALVSYPRAGIETISIII